MNTDTYEKMIALRLKGMAEAYLELHEDPTYRQWTFEEKLAYLVDREVDVKQNQKINRLIKNATLADNQAYIEGIHYYPDRELDKDLIQGLATCHFVTQPTNVLIVGPAGSGKSYLACALGHAACLKGLKTKYIRLPDLLTELALSRAEGEFAKFLRRYEKIDLLIIDEWLLLPTNLNQASDLLELFERRYRKRATILCSQFSKAGWHERLGGGAVADAVLDRLTSKCEEIEIKGEQSMRERID